MPPAPSSTSAADDNKFTSIWVHLLTNPRWCLGMLGTKRRHFGNTVGHAESVTDMSSLSSWTAQQFNPALSWADVKWIKKLWGGKLIVKGIMDAEDARLAVNSDAAALIVSNHGGRQLDGAASSISMLPAIKDAVGERIEIHMDGGIRSGQDALKAIALGAKGVHIGRAFLYGLGAPGEQGVSKCLDMIYREMDVTMAFCGHTDIKNVDSGILLPQRSAQARRSIGRRLFIPIRIQPTSRPILLQDGSKALPHVLHERHPVC